MLVTDGASCEAFVPAVGCESVGVSSWKKTEPGSSLLRGAQCTSDLGYFQLTVGYQAMTLL